MLTSPATILSSNKECLICWKGLSVVISFATTTSTICRMQKEFPGAEGFLRMESLAGIPVSEAENNQVENPQATPISNSGESELKQDEFWPLSGKPYFSVVLGLSHVKPKYQLYLPVKFCQALPASNVPVVLTYCGKHWGMIYVEHQNRFDRTWKTFVHDNDLKVGDACVFELVESSIDIIRFKVQILRGDFPPELEERVNVETPSTFIVLE